MGLSVLSPQFEPKATLCSNERYLDRPARNPGQSTPPSQELAVVGFDDIPAANQ